MIPSQNPTSTWKGWWLGTFQFVLFTGALILLVYNCYAKASLEIRRPIILCVASLMALPRFRNTPVITLLQNVVLLYCIGVLFNQAALRFIRLQIGSTHLEISLAFILLLPLTLQYAVYKLHASPSRTPEQPQLIRSGYLLATILLVHVLLLFFALKAIYGYGYEYSPAALAALCLYCLVFLFTWEALNSKWYAISTALICACLWGLLSIP